MAVTSEQFVQKALTQRGDRYVYATEASPLDPDPDEFDCSELVEWTGARLNVQPRIPDGSWVQRQHCRPIPVLDGIRTRGALLFIGTSMTHHVAISLGDGTTIEAKGRLFGVGVFAATPGRFDHAGIIPGIAYVKPGTGSKPPVNQGGGVGIMPGSDGRAVEFLSAMLNITRQHYNDTHGGADRRLIPVNWTYDNAVKAAVAEFQRDWNSVPAFTKLSPGKLPVTGGADPKTCAAIGIAVKLILGVMAGATPAPVVFWMTQVATASMAAYLFVAGLTIDHGDRSIFGLSGLDARPLYFVAAGLGVLVALNVRALRLPWLLALVVVALGRAVTLLVIGSPILADRSDELRAALGWWTIWILGSFPTLAAMASETIRGRIGH